MFGFNDNDIDKEKIIQFFKKNNLGSRKISLIVIGFIFVIGVLTCFYTVEPDEEAVSLRFGKYQQTVLPGLHFKLPFGIDSIVKVKTKRVLQEDFGFRRSQTRFSATRQNQNILLAESLMLTGDLNVANVQWTVQFQISDPRKFLFKTRDPKRILRDVSEAIMRRVVGDRLVTDILTIGRIEISDEAKRLTQELLNSYDIGLFIISVKLQDVNPPKPVQASFNEVNASKQEQEELINKAEKDYNQVIPEARGQADKEISQAEGYATATLNRAQGDAKRFETFYREYVKAPNITRKRLYLDAVNELLRKFENLTLIDERVKGILPLYSDKLSKTLEK